MDEQKEQIRRSNLIDRFNENKSSIIVLVCIGILVVIIASWSTISLREKTEKAWSLVGSASSVLAGNYSAERDLTIGGLAPQTQKFTKELLKGLDALPDQLKNEKLQRLEDLPVLYLPQHLQHSVIRRHYLEQLEGMILAVQNTSAAPWFYHTLGNLYFAEGNMQQALENYKKLRDMFPQHTLSQEIDVAIVAASKQKHWLESNNVNVTPKLLDPAQASERAVELITSEGNITLYLFDLTYPEVAEHFLSLVNKGFYNGLTFYQTSGESIHCGCPLGNGKGGPGFTKSVSPEEVYLQRGLVMLEQEEGEVGSRFFIQRKFSMNTFKKGVALGMVAQEDLDVLDKLKKFSVLLDVKLAEKAQM